MENQKRASQSFLTSYLKSHTARLAVLTGLLLGGLGLQLANPQVIRYFIRVKNQVRHALVEKLCQEEAGFNFTYKASRHEQLKLSQVLAAFYQDSLIN